MIDNDQLIIDSPYIKKPPETINILGDVSYRDMVFWNFTLEHARPNLQKIDDEHFLSWEHLDRLTKTKDRNHGWTKAKYLKLQSTLVLWDAYSEKTGELDVISTPMYSRLRFSSKGVHYKFDSYVIKKCSDPQVFALISKSSQIKLKGTDGWLYEQCLIYFNQNAGIGETPWRTPAEWRKRLHLDKFSSYDDFKALNRKINQCIKQIEENTEILLKPKRKRDGRRGVSEIKFMILKNPKYKSENAVTDEISLDPDIQLKLLDIGFTQRDIVAYHESKGEAYIRNGLELLKFQKDVESELNWLHACYSSKEGYNFSMLPKLLAQNRRKESWSQDQELQALKEQARVIKQKQEAEVFNRWVENNPEEYHLLAIATLDKLPAVLRHKLEAEGQGDQDKMLSIIKSKTAYKMHIRGEWDRSQ